jgi:hypothetical protein
MMCQYKKPSDYTFFLNANFHAFAIGVIDTGAVVGNVFSSYRKKFDMVPQEKLRVWEKNYP